MPDTDPCELCCTPAKAIPSGGYDGIHQHCPRCGEFKLSGTGMSIVRHVPPTDKVKLSGWVRDQNMLGEVPELTSDRIRVIAALPLPWIIERADRLLTFAVRQQSKLGEPFDSHDPGLLAITYSQDTDEVGYLLMFLKDEGLIEHVGGRGFQVTPRGHMRYEELQAH